MINERIIMGHTGYITKYPQNTLLSFKKAIEAGVDGVEIDVMLTSDNVWICIHASNFNTMTNGDGVVNHQPWSYAKELNVNFSDASLVGRPDTKVASLSQVLDQLSLTNAIIELDLKQWQANPYQVRSKREAEMKSLYQLVESKGMLNRVRFVSMEPISNDMKTYVPQAKTGVYYYGAEHSDYLPALQNTIQYGHEFVYWYGGAYDQFPNTYATKKMVDAFHAIDVPFGITPIYQNTYYETKVYDKMGVNLYMIDDIPEAIRALTDGIDIGIVLPGEPEAPVEPELPPEYIPPNPSIAVESKAVFLNGSDYDAYTLIDGEVAKMHVYYGEE